MSENNYGALMMKSELSTSDNIDELHLSGSYPVPPGNNSSPDLSGGILTIHPGTIKRRTFVSNSLIFAISTYNPDSLGKVRTSP